MASAILLRKLIVLLVLPEDYWYDRPFKFDTQLRESGMSLWKSTVNFDSIAYSAIM
jgi:hypothetical protein